MTYFEGHEFSTIYDQMPARPWNREKFFSDWRLQITEANPFFKEDDIKMAIEIVLSSFYDTYEQCIQMIDEDDSVSPEQREKMLSKLNLAMINLLEFGQRSNRDIVKSLEAKKFDMTENNGPLFNGIIDLLVQELAQANHKFYLKQEEFYAKKRNESSKK